MIATEPQPAAAPAQGRAPSPTALQGGLDDTSTLLPIGDLDPNPWNARRFAAHPDAEDRSLTESIRLLGVLENLLVRPQPDGRYQVIFGERRLRCARAAGRTQVPATIRNLDDHEARLLTVTENLQRKDLHFLEQAEAIAGLFDEGWTLDMVASQLGRPRSWVARRKHLLNLTLSWSQLAREPEPWTSGWSAAHFEHIATLAPEAQEHLLATESARLANCLTAGDLAQLTRSLTLDLSSFPWELDDAQLDPEAGACGVCPLRSSHHPGLFDDQEADLPKPPSGRRSRRAASGGSTETPAAAADRCLNPQCAARRGELFVAQKTAALAAKHPTVLRLQDDWSGRPIPGAVRAHQVQEVKQRTPGAVPAVVASGVNLGAVRWVLPPDRHRSRPDSRSAVPPAGKKPLAERRAHRDRQRKILALGMLHDRLLAAPAPGLSTSVRLAIVFGTYQTHRSSGSAHDPSLPRLALGASATAVSRHMLATLPLRTTRPPGHAGHAPVATDLDDSAAASPAPGGAAGTAAAAATDPAAAASDQAHPLDDACEGLDDNRIGSGTFVSASDLWQTFDSLAAHEALHPEILWARTLPVLLARIAPLPEAKDIQLEWAEAQRLADLTGLDLQAVFDLAVAKLPDPKSWAAEEAALAKTAAATDSSVSAEPPTRPRGRQATASGRRHTRNAAAPAEPSAA